MASGSQNLTTYYAKRIIGDTVATGPEVALIQTGDGITAGGWILGNNIRADSSGPKYGIVYKYDSSSNGTADTLEVYGGYQENNTDRPTAWIQMDMGNVHILGNVGIGYDPNTSGNVYKLYVNGAIAAVGNIDPSITNTYNLGGSSLVWANIYATTFHGAFNGNASTATTWQTSRILTIGATGKSVKGDANVSWSIDDIMGSSDSSKFYRGDKTWSNTLTGGLNLNGDLHLYTSSTDSPDIVWWYADKGQEQARIWMGSGGTTKWAPLYRCYSSSGTQLYSGTLVCGDGTGASGTWGVSVNGNAATATTWQTARTLTIGATGKSVDGSANVSWSHDEIHVLPFHKKVTTAASFDTYTDTALRSIYSTGNTNQPLPNHGILFTAGSDALGTPFQIFIGDTVGADTLYIYKRLMTGSWSKMRAGYADSAGSADSATNASHLAYAATVDSTDKMNAFGLAGNVTAAKFTNNAISGIASNDGLVLALGWSNKYGFQMAVDDQSNNFSIRSCSNGTWNAWTRVVTNSGSWNISVTSATQDGSGNVITSTYLPKREGGAIGGCSGNGSYAYCKLMTITASNAYMNNPVTFQVSGRGIPTSVVTIIFQNTSNTNPGVTAFYSSDYGNIWIHQDSTQRWGVYIQYTESWGSAYIHWISGNGNGYISSIDLANVSSVPSGSTQVTVRYWRRGDAVTGAVWNDYAEYRKTNNIGYGRVVREKGDDSLILTTERLQDFAGITSDTWGFAQGETNEAKTPIAVAGRVLTYPYQNKNKYHAGDCVCSAPDGTVDIMTREEIIQYPDKIVGTVSYIPDYEEWGDPNSSRGRVKVDGRIWIKVR